MSKLTTSEKSSLQKGWGGKKNIKLMKSKGRNSKKNGIKKKSFWYYNHVPYFQPSDKGRLKVCPECGALASFAYVKCVSFTDPAFRLDKMKFDEYNEQNLQWCFIKLFQELLPDLIEYEIHRYILKFEPN